jgi:hypothetical protein
LDEEKSNHAGLALEDSFCPNMFSPLREKLNKK